MLILAGISLNAVIGDNGIITQAQNATYMQSVAVLEEYLNNFYVEHYEDIKDEIPNITDLNLSGYNDRESQNILKDLKGIEKFTGLKKLTVNYTSANLDISAIKNCPTLEDVTLGYSNINSLNGIERLTNLKTLNIRNNNITALKPLENLKNLTSLNLQNNAIADTSSYIDTDGSTKTYRNLDILANLNSKRNGKLTELYLSGNNNIIDYSPVSNLTWSHKNGF